ncbi:MAG: response regulator transcription factor [Anaerolineales bacterium]|nr:MAG: response regulator transcription factor [Anaerolineales bacterium]
MDGHSKMKAFLEITISIGGGHELDRAGLSALIASLPGLRVVSLDSTPPPQVLVWDARTDLNALASVSQETAILLLVENSGLDLLPETVTGLLSRDETPAALGTAIRQVARGEQYLSPALAVEFLQKSREKSSLTESQNSYLESLSNREREILDLLSQGLSNKTIASQLYLSVRTVEGHLANIYLRLGVHSRTEAMLIAVKDK